MGGWLCLVKPPCALLLPLVLILECGLSGELSGFFFFLSWVCSIYPEARRRGVGFDSAEFPTMA